MSAPLTAPQRAALAVLADEVAPASGRMPAASSLGLAEAGGMVDRVLGLRPDLAAALGPILDGAAPAEGFAMERHGPPERAVLLEVLAGAYYLHPEVRRLIGYAGQEALGLGRGEIGAEELLAEMMEATPRWRRPPGDGQP